MKYLDSYSIHVHPVYTVLVEDAIISFLVNISLVRDQNAQLDYKINVNNIGENQ